MAKRRKKQPPRKRKDERTAQHPSCRWVVAASVVLLLMYLTLHANYVAELLRLVIRP